MRKATFAAAAALIASSFTPISFVSPAYAGEGDGDLGLCTPDSNPNIEFIRADTEYEGDQVTLGATRRAGTSGNVFVMVEVVTGETTQTCIAYNTSGNHLQPAKNQTFVSDWGGELISSEEVKVCTNKSGSPGTEVTAAGTGYGFTQADCEAAVA